MTTPPTGPDQPSKQPPLPPSGPSNGPKPLTPSDKEDAFLLTSPFAKMFERTGAMPTGKEIRAIINGILKQQVDAIKKQDASWKKAMKKLKDVIEGKD